MENFHRDHMIIVESRLIHLDDRKIAIYGDHGERSDLVTSPNELPSLHRNSVLYIQLIVVLTRTLCDTIFHEVARYGVLVRRNNHC